MRRLHLLLAALLLLAAPFSVSSQESAPEPDGAAVDSDEDLAPPPPPPCGTAPVTVARMTWPSAALLAEVHARLLTENFECKVVVQQGDLAQTASGMGAIGEPSVAPELWVSRIADIWNAAMRGQTVRQAGNSYDQTVFEGWFVPDYTAALLPDVTTIEGLKAHAAEFGGSAGKGRFISCPRDWGCAVVNRNLMRALGLDQLFDIVEPGNRFEMDTLIAEAVGRKQPLLFYYWQPNAVLAQFVFKPVTLPSYDHDSFQCLGRAVCPMPSPTGFAPEPVVTALAERIYLDAPQVAAYFQRAHMPIAEMNRMLLELGEPGGSIESVADRFVAERAEIWRPWLGPQLTLAPASQ